MLKLIPIKWNERKLFFILISKIYKGSEFSWISSNTTARSYATRMSSSLTRSHISWKGHCNSSLESWSKTWLSSFQIWLIFNHGRKYCLLETFLWIIRLLQINKWFFNDILNYFYLMVCKRNLFDNHSANVYTHKI